MPALDPSAATSLPRQRLVGVTHWHVRAYMRRVPPRSCLPTVWAQLWPITPRLAAPGRLPVVPTSVESSRSTSGLHYVGESAMILTQRITLRFAATGIVSLHDP